ncbi:hypothetical protein LBWT_X0030 (plasmid) [Leptolyngbya boryana IAM M-101]|nr:hypothetical protein [Leptolyngbya sp. FACHB-161]BAS59931.1 hypothetical protein LBWT_X0030 [Leptolyngbya boryana IAM M-101]BAS66279.1 hypothetical protein LBDG_X0030 [Leptolyngbya boryana dg5]
MVEAFNITFAEILASDSRQFGSEHPTVFYCGDDAEEGDRGSTHSGLWL